MNLIHIPLAEIRADALLRDRTALDPDALDELVRSIFDTGLHTPIEVWRLSTPEPPCTYGLVAGLRRLTAFHALQSWPDPARFATIPALVLDARDLPQVMAVMVAENEVRAPVAPWDKGRLLVEAVDRGIFPTLDAAVDGLHPSATRQKRSRLRSHALVVEATEGRFTTPERLTQAQMDRLAAALRGNLGAVIDQVLAETSGTSLATQWAALLPVLAEALSPDPDADSARPGRPRRLLALRSGQGLMIRRERTRAGWALHFTGPEARKGGLVDDILDKVEHWFGQE
jgi:ParB family transcriptional regulator, chromosome partitioning protein